MRRQGGPYVSKNEVSGDRLGARAHFLPYSLEVDPNIKSWNTP